MSVPGNQACNNKCMLAKVVGRISEQQQVSPEWKRNTTRLQMARHVNGDGFLNILNTQKHKIS